MEVGREFKPPVVPAGPEDRGEEGLIVGEHDRGIDPRQQLIGALVPELQNHGRLVRDACLGDPPGLAGLADHLLSHRDSGAQVRKARCGAGADAVQPAERFLVLAPEAAAAVPGTQHRHGLVLIGEPLGEILNVGRDRQAVRRPRRRRVLVGLLAKHPDEAKTGQVAGQRLGP